MSCYKGNKISNHTEGKDLYGSPIIHKHQKKYAFIYRQVKYDMNRNISRENTDVKLKIKKASFNINNIKCMIYILHWNLNLGIFHKLSEFDCNSIYRPNKQHLQMTNTKTV